MNDFKRSVRWWVFLPFVPVLLLLVLEYWERVFYSLGLARMYSVTELLLVTDGFVLLPWFLVGALVIPVGVPNSPTWQIVAFMLSASLYSVMLYGAALLVAKKRKNRVSINS